MMRTIRPILLALAALWTLSSCFKELDGPVAPITPAEGKVLIDGSVCLPGDVGAFLGTKAFGEAPRVYYLYLAVFDESDILTEIVEAKPGSSSHPGNPDEGFDAGSAPDYLTPFYVEMTGVENDDRYIQFIATTESHPTLAAGAVNKMDEAAFVQNLSMTGGAVAFWGRTHVTSITMDTHFSDILMVRNYAKVKVEESADNFEIVGFKVFDTPVYGTIAPFNNNAQNYLTINDEVRINFDRFARYSTGSTQDNPYTWFTSSDKYYGFMPQDIQYDDLSSHYSSDGSDTMVADGVWLDPVNDADYLYECSFRPDRNPFIIMKANYTDPDTSDGDDSGTYYYKADFVYQNGELGSTEYYNILRNFQYTLKVTGVDGKGSSTVYDAVNSIALNNFQGSTLAQSLTNIATDDSRLYVSHTDVLITKGTTLTMYVKSRTGENYQTNDNGGLTAAIRTPSSGSYIVSDAANIVISGSDEASGEWAGWRKVTITVTDPSSLGKAEVWKQTIQFSNTAGLVRTVNLTLRRPFSLAVDVTDVVEKVKDSECEVSFSIPAGLTEARFPMYFYIEQEENMLYPLALADGDAAALTVESGASKIPENESANTFYYRRMISWTEFSTTSTDAQGNKTFTSYFKSLRPESATTVWVIPAEENDYYNPFDDIENEYTNKDSFLNEKIAGKVSFPNYGLQLAPEDFEIVEATTNSDGTIIYTSSAPAVATVSSSGKVTAVAEGTATITASVAATGSYTAASDSYTVTVTEDALCGLKLDWDFEPNPVVVVGSTIHNPLAVVTVADGYDAANVEVTYTTSPSGIITVDDTTADADGYVKITGAAAGTVTVTATAVAPSTGDFAGMTQSISYELTVVMDHPASGTIYHNESFLGPTLGDYTYTETVKDYNGNDKTSEFYQYTTYKVGTSSVQRHVWYPYYNYSTEVGYGAAASGYGAIEAPTSYYDPETHTTSTKDHDASYTTHAELISKEIDLSASAGVTLSFYHAGNYFYNSSADIVNSQTIMQGDAKVYISKDGGANWTQASVKYYPSGSSWTYIRTSVEIPDDYLTAAFRLKFDYTSVATRMVQETDADSNPLYYATETYTEDEEEKTRVLTTTTTENTGYPVMSVDADHPGRAGTWEIKNVLIKEN